ncbi:MAG: DUF4845 domain-containing protein [Burkholderiales bacterium]
MRKNQLGVSLSGLLMFSVVLIFVLLLGFKLFKPYSEYFALQKIFRTLAVKPEVRNGTRRDFTVAWAPYAQIEGVTAIGGDDVEITKEGTNVVLSASYQTKVPLFKNFALLIDFHPTSAAKGP